MDAKTIIRVASTLVIAFGTAPLSFADEAAAVSPVVGETSTTKSQASTSAPASSSSSSSSAAAPVSQAAASGGVSAIAPNCSCMAAEPNGDKKHKGGPVRHVLRGLSKELGSDLSDMGKDSMFVFSAQDFDPYASKPGKNPKRPYVIGAAEYVDGSSAKIMKFPDRSLRIYGGYADGTYACPISEQSSNFVVYYPNGVRGELTLHPDGTAIIKRPDNTITKITKTNAGYKITNDKLGYMGDINPDVTGMNYELGRSSNAANNLE